jgi:predicted dienelactone hydrolase
MKTALLFLALALLGTNAKHVRGPYLTATKLLENPKADSSDRKIGVRYPTGPAAKGKKFPLISYAHGLGGGGTVAEPLGYTTILDHIASFGYVVAAPQACNTGCHDDRTSLPFDPPGFANFYQQQLLTIDWAKDTLDEKLGGLINFTVGTGIAGHSMGGQATVFSAAYAGNSTKYNIKAAVMHHAYTHTYPAPQVPFLAMTGAHDGVAPAEMTQKYYEAKGVNPIKGHVNKEACNHFEANDAPVCDPYCNPELGQFTAAWFKIYLDKTPQADKNDYHEMIYGTSKDSLCGGGDGKMAKDTKALKGCEVHE